MPVRRRWDCDIVTVDGGMFFFEHGERIGRKAWRESRCSYLPQSTANTTDTFVQGKGVRNKPRDP